MNILWCGGEDIDFPNGATPSWSTSSQTFRSGFARGSMQTSAEHTAPVKSITFPGGAITSGWLCGRLYGGTTTNKCYLGFGKSGTVKGLYMGAGTVSGKLTLFKYDGSSLTTLVTEDSVSFPASILTKFDLEVVNFNNANGTFRLYMNGNLVLEYTGDLTISGITNLDQVFFGGGPSTAAINYSEIIVADSDTRNLSLITAVPAGNGTTREWTGAYTDINENTNANDATVNYYDTAAKRQEYTLTQITSGWALHPLMVKQSIRASKSSDASISTIKMGVNSGGTRDVDAGHTCTTTWQTFERFMSQNPVGPAAWTITNLNALQSTMDTAA